ncbi:unnamed protein product [Prunus armeniaca]
MTTSSLKSGGDTKILVIDHNIKLFVFASKLTSLCDTPNAFVFYKYQLLGEDLNALNSVANDEDLDHMMIKDCLEAELWRLFFGLKVVVGKGLSKIIAEMDSVVSVHLIQEPILATLHSLASILTSCVKLMNQFDSCAVMHIYREKNCVANRLANWSYNMGLGTKWNMGLNFVSRSQSCVIFGAHFSESLMKRFRGSYFGYLLGLHKIAFSGQIVHALALRRVRGFGVKDMLSLSYVIGSNVVQFSVKDFCLISGLKCGTEPDITSGGDAHNRFMKAHFTNRGHITCHDLENAFLKSERGSEDSFKLGLLYFVEFVIMDSLLFAPRKKETDEENDGKGKGQKKGKKAVRSLVRKGKKNVEDEKPKRINRPGWSIKGLSYALQPVILCLLRPSQLEISQPYWSWGLDVPECDAPSVALRVCKDLDELNSNSIVQQLRNEVVVLLREKGQLEEKVLRLEKCTSHADARKTGDAGEERNKTEDAGEERNKTGDAGEESGKIEDGGVAESREHCVQNANEEVQYTPSED